MFNKSLVLGLTLGAIFAIGGSARASDVAPEYQGSILVGSAAQLDVLKPESYKRVTATDAVEYDDKAVIGYSDYRIALLHSYNRPQSGYGIGIDLKSQRPITEPLTVTFIARPGAGETLEDALQALYGATPEAQVGYIYTLEASEFRSEKGLARKEMASHKSFAHPLSIKVNRRAEIDRLVAEGKIKLVYRKI